MAFGALSRVRSVGLLSGSLSPIAIDFGVGSLKVLQVSVGDPHALVAAAQFDTPDDALADHAKRFEYQSQCLTRLVKGGQFRGRRVICGISAVQMYCKHIRVPKSEPNVGEAVQAAVSSELGCHPGALAYRHVVVGEVGSGQVEVICLAVPQDLIGRIMTLLRACRLEPVGIIPASLATIRGVDPAVGHVSGPDSPLTANLFLDIGAGSTTCLVAYGGDLLFAKTMHLGGTHLDGFVSRQLRCTLMGARARRRAAAGVSPGQRATGVAVAEPGHDASARFDLADALDTIADEAAMCLRYHLGVSPERPPSRVVFVGGESRHHGLCRHIAKALSLPGVIADPLALLVRGGDEPAVGVDFSMAQPAWAVPLGLCLSPTDS